jgi:predicted transcriptional regulator
MASTFAEYVPPAIRMERALAAVKTGKMSQRAAAAKFDVTQSVISDRLNKVIGSDHPETSQSQQGVSRGQHKAESGPDKLTKDQVRSKLRELCRQQKEKPPAGITKTNPKMRGWLMSIGLELPKELQGTVTAYQNSSLSDQLSAQPTSEPASFNNGRLSSTDQENCTDEFDEPIGDQINRVCDEVQQSDRPSDFKRAILILRELTEICTKAWYGAFEEEQWNHHDWAHVNSDIKTIQSLVSQRAQETSNELLYSGVAN